MIALRGPDAAVAGARAVVLGLARSGEAAARALLEHGADVAILDGADGRAQRERAERIPAAHAVLGRTDAADLAGADLVVTSPGVPWGHPWLEAARAQGLPIWGEVELAYRLGRRPVIGITGTNGKTTTTEMVAAILRAAGRDAVAAGNIGAPILDAPETVEIVAELSSFQLQAIEAFHVPVAVLLNLAPDHVDWHGSFEAYGAAKARIFENQTPEDAAVVHADPLCGALAGRARSRRIPFYEHSVPLAGAGVEDGWIVVPEGRVVALEALAFRARAFVADAVAAAAAGCAAGVQPAVAGEALASFRLRPHRLEEVATIGGVRFVNDSKATDPHAALAALAEQTTPVVLIAGGLDRSKDLASLLSTETLPRAVVAIGEAAAEVERVFASAGVEVARAASMDEAVDAAVARAATGDTVLLSPACASLDMFVSYEERGAAFVAAVRRLEGR